MNKEEDLKYLKLAYKEALKAYKLGEVPVGAIVVMDDKVIAKAYNKRETKKLVLAHAEMEAIAKACKKVQTKFLDGATIYITLEPCLMCLGAIIQARFKRIVYSACEPKFGCLGSIGNPLDDYTFNVKVDISKGIMEKEVKDLMKMFFQELRKK